MASPEDKEMKKQWITVDGRQTPIILPQIWDHDKEEWIVTGTNNPLPTQVTGSIVQKEVLRNETITEGASVDYNHTAVGNKLAIGIRWYDRTQFEVSILPRNASFNQAIGERETVLESSNDAFKAFHYEIYSPYTQIRITNKSDDSSDLMLVSITDMKGV